MRRREVEPRPSLDVQIATAVTTLDESGVRYRGYDVAELSRHCTFEQVAELLWTASSGPSGCGTRAEDGDLATAIGGHRRRSAPIGVPALVAVPARSACAIQATTRRRRPGA